MNSSALIFIFFIFCIYLTPGALFGNTVLEVKWISWKVIADCRIKVAQPHKFSEHNKRIRIAISVVYVCAFACCTARSKYKYKILREMRFEWVNSTVVSLYFYCLKFSRKTCTGKCERSVKLRIARCPGESHASDSSCLYRAIMRTIRSVVGINETPVKLNWFQFIDHNCAWETKIFKRKKKKKTV